MTTLSLPPLTVTLIGKPTLAGRSGNLSMLPYADPLPLVNLDGRDPALALAELAAADESPTIERAALATPSTAFFAGESILESTNWASESPLFVGVPVLREASTLVATACCPLLMGV